MATKEKKKTEIPIFKRCCIPSSTTVVWVNLRLWRHA
jgi:hypothetical protein